MDEIAELVSVRRRKGILIRLHALGDFYSLEYVRFWRTMLELHPRLSIYGYTAHAPHSEIGAELLAMDQDFGGQIARFGRSAIRFSNGGTILRSTISIETADQKPSGSFVCPEQTDATRCCATCAACWSPSISFAAR